MVGQVLLYPKTKIGYVMKHATEGLHGESYHATESCHFHGYDSL